MSKLSVDITSDPGSVSRLPSRLVGVPYLIVDQPTSTKLKGSYFHIHPSQTAYLRFNCLLPQTLMASLTTSTTPTNTSRLKLCLAALTRTMQSLNLVDDTSTLLCEATDNASITTVLPSVSSTTSSSTTRPEDVYQDISMGKFVASAARDASSPVNPTSISPIEKNVWRLLLLAFDITARLSEASDKSLSLLTSLASLDTSQSTSVSPWLSTALGVPGAPTVLALDNPSSDPTLASLPTLLGEHVSSWRNAESGLLAVEHSVHEITRAITVTSLLGSSTLMNAASLDRDASENKTKPGELDEGLADQLATSQVPLISSRSLIYLGQFLQYPLLILVSLATTWATHVLTKKVWAKARPKHLAAVAPQAVNKKNSQPNPSEDIVLQQLSSVRQALHKCLLSVQHSLAAIATTTKALGDAGLSALAKHHSDALLVTKYYASHLYRSCPSSRSDSSPEDTLDTKGSNINYLGQGTVTQNHLRPIIAKILQNVSTTAHSHASLANALIHILAPHKLSSGQI